MAKSLTNETKEGAVYTRPPAVEASIDEALGQDQSTILRRAGIRDRKDPEYLPSECLLHLVREARRRGDKRSVERLLRPLLNRCEALLKAAIRDGGRADAGGLREEVMQRFCELIAKVGTSHDTRPLDYFEIRFNHALTTLRYKVLAADDRKRKIFKYVVQEEDENGKPLEAETALARISAAAQNPGQQENLLFLKEVFKILKTCSPEEQEAIMLCYVKGYKVESEDLDEITAATICGVEGRTIRNRLARASKKLKHLKEEMGS
ncbi:MAG TPA: hypothetical protein VEF76_04335 [Patescibacteria group bacterium]|nr:hypothetical protein [Patescibacteria group bacterium]